MKSIGLRESGMSMWFSRRKQEANEAFYRRETKVSKKRKVIYRSCVHHTSCRVKTTLRSEKFLLVGRLANRKSPTEECEAIPLWGPFLDETTPARALLL